MTVSDVENYAQKMLDLATANNLHSATDRTAVLLAVINTCGPRLDEPVNTVASATLKPLTAKATKSNA